MAYNGWENYETWAVALWIDNEEGTHRERLNIMRDVRREFEDGDGTLPALADSLKEWVESELIPDLGASLAADLLGAALSEVDWREIAGNWLEE